MTSPATPLADAFAALAAELRVRAESGTGQGAEAAWQALVLLGLVRVLWVLHAIALRWQAPRPVSGAGHTLLAASYPRAATPRRILTPRQRAELKDITRPYQAKRTVRPVARAHSAAAVPPILGPARPHHHPRLARTPAPRSAAFSKAAFRSAPTCAHIIS